MRYVDDLTKVKPEEIQHICDEEDTPIQAIIVAKNPKTEFHAITVIWENGTKGSYSLSGVHKGADQMFTFKTTKKVGYINIYRHNLTSGRYGATIFEVELDALHMKEVDADYITTIKIQWEE